MMFLIFLMLFFEKKNESFSQPQPLNKTIVLFSFSDQNNNKNSLETLHKKLISSGVDAVSYVDSLNFYSNKEVTEYFIDYINKREIKSVIFFSETNNKIITLTPDELKNNTKEAKGYSGDSSFFYFSKDLKKTPSSPLFLFSPNPELINKITPKKYNEILFKPNLEKEKIGVFSTKKGTETKNTILLEEKSDYRFYYSNGINYVVHFYKGREDFLRNTYKIKNLKEDSKKEILILVLEHTATRNRFFYFAPMVTDESELFSLFIN